MVFGEVAHEKVSYARLLKENWAAYPMREKIMAPMLAIDTIHFLHSNFVVHKQLIPPRKITTSIVYFSQKDVYWGC